MVKSCIAKVATEAHVSDRSLMVDRHSVWKPAFRSVAFLQERLAQTSLGGLVPLYS